MRKVSPISYVLFPFSVIGMVIEELKKDCLRALGVSFYEDGYSLIEARRYDGGLDGAILRAYDRMKAKGVIPELSVCLEDVEESGVVSYETRDLFDGDFTGAYRIDEGSGEVKEERVNCVKVGGTLTIMRNAADGVYLKYVPRLDLNSREFDMPDSLSRLIPYFVKSELLDDEDYPRAAAARNLFEQSLDEYVSFDAGGAVKAKYKYQ